MSCAVDIDNGLACKHKCEERAKSINKMIDSNSRVMTVANKQLRGGMIFTIVAGALFVALGLYFKPLEGSPWIIFVALGATFIVRGIFAYRRSARYPTIPEKTEQGAAANP
jgi:hypothetical protein